MSAVTEILTTRSADEKRALLAELLAYPGVPQQWRTPDPAIAAVPLLPLDLCKGGVRMSFFTTLATLGTPQDITLEELRIESFFPANQETEDTIQRLSQGDEAAS